MAVQQRPFLSRLFRAFSSVFDPGVLLHPLRLLHYYGCSHVKPRRQLTHGRDVRIAPNVSFADAERIALGDQVQVGARCALWAGRSTSWIPVGARTTFGPDRFVIAADYGFAADRPITDQPMIERDITIGADCWIGTRAILTAGITIGDGAVICAGSAVTRDVPAGATAAGSPARVIRMRI